MDVLSKFRLDKKVCVVTGASKNIGLEISRAFADVGATVCMVALEEDLLEDGAENLRAMGAKVATVTADVSTPAGCGLVIDVVQGKFGHADVLVNCAAVSGGTHDVDPLLIDHGVWQTVLETNLLGPYRLIAGLGAGMRSGSGGSIINVLSGAGFLPTPGSTPYGVSKSALWTLTRYMATELAPHIRVNALVPGLTMSETGGPQPSSRVDEVLMPLIPLGRAGHPTEVAPAAVYLASEAASYTTGTVLFVNGGRLW